MRLDPSPHAMHIFVCQHAREDGRASCGQRGGAELLSELKRLCRERNLEARVTGSGCLGPCEKGPNAMVYPQRLWFHGVEPQDLPALVDHLQTISGQVSGGARPGSAVD